ncbi:MAG TPA: sialate O-acetylesterase, partial [Flavisolibacter sp.]|nr:sialate O-acetylesterase [Flavisolibacter sp.]
MRILLALFFTLIGTMALCQIKLPRLISDGMVLQRETPVKLWGWAAPGEKVSLHFKQRHYQAITDDQGKWKIELPAQKAGGP